MNMRHIATNQPLYQATISRITFNKYSVSLIITLIPVTQQEGYIDQRSGDLVVPKIITIKLRCENPVVDIHNLSCNRRIDELIINPREVKFGPDANIRCSQIIVKKDGELVNPESINKYHIETYYID